MMSKQFTNGYQYNIMVSPSVGSYLIIRVTLDCACFVQGQGALHAGSHFSLVLTIAPQSLTHGLQHAWDLLLR